MSSTAREIERERLNRLYETDLDKWSDDDISEILTERYRETEVPPCCVCGAELSCQAFGNGPTVWACSGRGDDGSMLPGRQCADEHYGRSRWEDRRQGGDSLVMELLRRWRLGL